MNKILFREEQQFRQWWQIVIVLAAILPTMLICIYALFQQTVRGVKVGNSPAPNSIMVITILGLCVLLWGMYSLKLEVWIDHKGIHYRFFPLVIKNKFISKEEILRFEIRQYKPIWDYGGWGVRTGIGRKMGKAYTVSGNIGLQLYLKNGKKVLFGTQKSQSIEYAMKKIMEPREIVA